MDDSHSKERLRQLNQEIDMLKQLSHQNIVQYYGSELADEALSIYLEYVSGGSIHKLLREYGPFKEPVIRNYTRQILQGLPTCMVGILYTETLKEQTYLWALMVKSNLRTLAWLNM